MIIIRYTHNVYNKCVADAVTVFNASDINIHIPTQITRRKKNETEIYQYLVATFNANTIQISI